jgi:hypothetical protein
MNTTHTEIDHASLCLANYKLYRKLFQRNAADFNEMCVSCSVGHQFFVWWTALTEFQKDVFGLFVKKLHWKDINNMKETKNFLYRLRALMSNVTENRWLISELKYMDVCDIRSHRCRHTETQMDEASNITSPMCVHLDNRCNNDTRKFQVYILTPQ